MDLTYMPDELAFQREVRAWLKRNVPKRQRDERPIEFGDPRRIAEAKAWQRKVYEAGYLALAWPREWGGHGSRSEEHTSELQSRSDPVRRLLLEKKTQPRYQRPTPG